MNLLERVETTILLPVTTRRSLARIPPGVPAILLVRHADRAGALEEAPADDVPLTYVGIGRAGLLGGAIGRRLRSIGGSPVLRCRVTAEEAFRHAGVGAPLRYRSSPLLGAPGAFVTDPERAGAAFRERPYAELMDALVAGRRVPGFTAGGPAARRLAEGLRREADRPGVHLRVSHDSIVGLFFHQAFGWRVRERWPAWLEGGAIWWEGDRGTVAWGDETASLDSRR